MSSLREQPPPEELQKQDRPHQPIVSLEAMRNSLLTLHTPDSEVGQEIQRAYEEAVEGKIGYLLELYEKQQEQLDRFAEDELQFFGNILYGISQHWGEYFHQQGEVFQQYQEFIGPLFEGCDGRFEDLVDLHTTLISLGSLGKANIFLKQRLEMVVGKITSFQEPDEEKAIQDPQLFLTDVRLKLREIIGAMQDLLPRKKQAQGDEDVFEYYENDDIEEDRTDEKRKEQTPSASDTAGVEEDTDTQESERERKEGEPEAAHEIGDIMTRVTEDDEQMLLWKKMIRYGFFRGRIREREPGVFILSLTHQVLPWCGLPPEEFFQKNRRYHDLFPQALAEIVNPKTGEYFPEAVFLDDSGYALRYFLQDRWDEYLRTPQYRIYYYEFIDPQVPFAA